VSPDELAKLNAPKHMSESYTSFDLPLKSDPELFQRYVNQQGGFSKLKHLLLRPTPFRDMLIIQEWANY
jgi:hypothetical protein